MFGCFQSFENPRMCTTLEQYRPFLALAVDLLGCAPKGAMGFKIRKSKINYRLLAQ